MRQLFAAALLFLAVVALPARATDLNRCIGADGHPVFTDKPCEDLGATVRPEPAAAPTSGTSTAERAHPRDCARTTDTLQKGLQAAIAAGDVNQVAAFYHWPGISSAESEEILKRLQVIAARPVLSLDLIRPQQAQGSDGYRTVASELPREASAIEVVQVRSAGDPERIHTVLMLIPYAGCWWVHF
jgi:hypothetical protein